MSIKAWSRAWLRALSQIVLSEFAPAGILILVAIILVAPFSALGAAIGALAGTVAGRFSEQRDLTLWESGLYGVNPAIIGIMWGGPLSRADAGAPLFLLALVIVLLADQKVRTWLYRAGLPPLATTALVAGWCSHWVYETFGVAFWQQEWLLPFGAVGVYAAVAIFALVVAQLSLRACIQGLLLGGVVAIATAVVSGEQWGLPGLWAFAVAPAAVIPHILLRPRPRAAAASAFLAAALASAIWGVWIVVVGEHTLPPLLAPCFAGIWIALRIVVPDGGQWAMEPIVWRAVGAIEESLDKGKPIAVLTGAGVSTAAGIPDYLSGAWFDPHVPATNYSFDVFKASRKCRVAYWEACSRFRRTAEETNACEAHLALSSLQKAGVVSTIVTQNVDGLHRAAGSPNVIELHGNIFEQRCLKCHRVEQWHDGVDWRDDDVTCSHCGGLMKPAVIALGEDIPPKAWREAREAVSGCGVLLVVGTQLAISSAARLLGAARREGAQIVFVNAGDIAQPLLVGDIFITGPAERVLPAIRWLMPDRSKAASPLAKLLGSRT